MREKRVVKEDSLLTTELLDLVKKLHNFDELVQVRRHVYIAHHEVDVVATYVRNSKKYRIGFELKLMRLFNCGEVRKALQQALDRCKYFNAFYVVFAQYDDWRKEVVDDDSVTQFKICLLYHNDIANMWLTATKTNIGIIVRQCGMYVPVTVAYIKEVDYVKSLIEEAKKLVQS